jgi:DNA-binding response OmpR family regulator
VTRILVCEPHPEVRNLLVHVVKRLGHDAVFPEDSDNGLVEAAAADVLVVEPADPHALATAQDFRREREDAPIVCASIYPPSAETHGLEPVAYLVKPFALGELEAALSLAAAGIRVAA